MINSSMEPSKLYKGKFRIFTPMKILNLGWQYNKIYGSDLILGVRVNLSKVFFVVEEDDKPVLQVNTKQPVIEFENMTESIILSSDEYEKILQSGFDS